MGCGSGMTCWRGLRDRSQAGVWRGPHQVLREELAQADRIDRDRAALDSAEVAAPGAAKKRARIQRIAPNRARSASLWSTPPASRSRSCSRSWRAPRTCPIRRRRSPPSDAIAPIRAKMRGGPRRRPHKLHADKGDGYRHPRLAPRRRRIIPRIVRCGGEPKNRLGRYRWVVERTLSWLNRVRRLKVRDEHRADIRLAFVQLGRALVSLRFLGQPRPTRGNGRPGPPRTASATLGA